MRCTNVSQLQAGVAKCVGESGLGLSWGHSFFRKVYRPVGPCKDWLRSCCRSDGAREPPI